MNNIAILIFLFVLAGCGKTPDHQAGYPGEVGDISFDPGIDNPGFVVCNEKQILQYYNFGKGLRYTGEKTRINEHFQKELAVPEQVGQSGFLTIRFIVNCHGATGRFRIQGMDTSYHEKEFDKNIVDRYLSLTRKMDGWIPGEDGANKFDYYQYLTFKIENGKLIEIMP